MAKLYKLTNEVWETYNNTKWGPYISHSATGEGNLCSKGWIHAYTDPVLAIMMKPIHANFDPHVLWLADGEVGISDNGLKVGCKKLTTIKIIESPIVQLHNRIAFGILAAKCVYTNPQFNSWASEWLNNKDRTYRAAAAAAAAADAAYAAAAAAADAAYAAAACAADAAGAAAAAAAACAAAAADAADAAAPCINLIQIAQEAMLVTA